MGQDGMGEGPGMVRVSVRHGHGRGTGTAGNGLAVRPPRHPVANLRWHCTARYL